MKLVIDIATVSEKISLDELIALETGNMPAKRAKVLLARFAVDDEGAAIAPEQAEKLLGAFNLGELRRAVVTLTKAIQGLLSEAVPPETGGS
jgi:hypothetical protein